MDGSNFNQDQNPWGPAPAPPPTLRPVEFVSDGKRFLKLLVRGAALTLVTFGFYRFWLTTDIRRHLWSHTLLDGENAEYTGTGRELLIGFLFALAILVPIYLAYFLIGIEAERAQAFASVPLGLFLVLFGYFATYRARRYRLTRTLWRGVRFWMQGSGWKYAFRAFGWGILVVLTLGAAYPWRAASLERYKMKHTFYGELQGDFDARPFDFFKKGVWMWLFVLFSVVATVAGTLMVSLKDNRAATGGILTVVGILALLAVPFLYPFFKGIEWRWWANGVRFGDTRLQCELRGGQLLGLFFKYVVIASVVTSAIAALVFAFGAAFAEIAGIDLTKMNLKSFNDLLRGKGVVLLIAGAFGYLIVLLAAGVVQRFFLNHEYWKLITGTMTIVKPEAMEGVAAKGDLANALGEGLADGFDIAGF